QASPSVPFSCMPGKIRPSRGRCGSYWPSPFFEYTIHMAHPGSIVILDFGGQYAHLIASRIRRMGAFSEIFEPEVDPETLKHCAGIILSGGPQSVYDVGSPQAHKGILELGIPVLGLCYGHQWLAHALGGKVQPGKVKEYGDTQVRVVAENALFKGLPQALNV